RLGLPLEAVPIGPEAALEDVAGFVRALGTAARQETMRVWVLPAGRAHLEALQKAGLMEGLRAAGVTILDPGSGLPEDGAGPGLCCGVPVPALARARRAWSIAGPAACAAAARAGRWERPADWPAVAPVRLEPG